MCRQHKPQTIAVALSIEISHNKKWRFTVRFMIMPFLDSKFCESFSVYLYSSQSCFFLIQSTKSPAQTYLKGDLITICSCHQREHGSILHTYFFFQFNCKTIFSEHLSALQWQLQEASILFLHTLLRIFAVRNKALTTIKELGSTE